MGSNCGGVAQKLQELLAAGIARTGGQCRGADLDGDVRAVKGVGAGGIVAVSLDFNRAVVLEGHHVAGGILDNDRPRLCC